MNHLEFERRLLLKVIIINLDLSKSNIVPSIYFVHLELDRIVDRSERGDRVPSTGTE